MAGAFGLFYGEAEKKRQGGQDFETLTFSDPYGRNVHCSPAGTCLKTGADLSQDYTLAVRETGTEEADKSIASFLSKENALIFGCAGLRSLLDGKVYTGKHSLAGYLFGELVTIEGKPMFGNLMMVRLVKKSGG